MASTNDLKNGLVLNLDGQLWTVVEFQHVKPGKGPAFVRTKLKHVLSGKVVDKTFNAGTKVDTATVDKRDMQYLYKDGEDYVFMDKSTYEQLPIPAATVGDAARFLLESAEAVVATHEENPLFVELPTSVVLEVTYTEPGLQATAPPAAPSRPRWRPGTRSRSRSSSRPAPRSRWTPARVTTSAGSTEPDRPSSRKRAAHTHGSTQQGPQAGARHPVRGRRPPGRPADDPGRP